MVFRYATHQTGLVRRVRLAETGFDGAAGVRPVRPDKRVKRKLHAASRRHSWVISSNGQRPRIHLLIRGRGPLTAAARRSNTKPSCITTRLLPCWRLV